MNKLKLSILLSAFYFLVPASFAGAATFYFNSDIGSEVGVGQIIPVNILLDSDGQNLNAVETKIIYSGNLLKPVSVNDASSIFGLWLERPNLESGALAVKGIIPNGFNWNAGVLLRVYFEALRAGEARLSFEQTSALLNDGQGTKAQAKLKPLNIRILSAKELQQIAETDPYLPESFKPVIIQNPDIFDGKYAVIFSTQDKQSGIAYYEVQESLSRRPDSDKWEKAESPYLLKDQPRYSYVFVKAVDQKGNERIMKLPPLNYAHWYQRPIAYLIFLILLLTLLTALKRYML